MYNVVYTIMYNIVYNVVYTIMYNVVYNVVYTIMYNVVYTIILYYNVVYTIILYYNVVYTIMYNVVSSFQELVVHKIVIKKITTIIMSHPLAIRISDKNILLKCIALDYCLLNNIGKLLKFSKKTEYLIRFYNKTKYLKIYNVLLQTLFGHLTHDSSRTSETGKRLVSAAKDIIETCKTPVSAAKDTIETWKIPV